MVQGLLVTHGALGCELIKTAEAILGPQSDVRCLSNQGSSLDGLAERIREALGEGTAPAVIFVDLLGGSPGHACRALTGGDRPLAIFSGVNLPMILEFFYNRDRVPFAELRERLLRKGLDGIRSL